MLKKNLIVAFAFVSIVLSSTVVAQDAPALSDNNNNETQKTSQLKRWTFGGQIGWSENTPIISLPAYASDMKYLKEGGMTYGANARYRIKDWLYARADIMWIQKNYTINRTGSAAKILGSTYYNNYFNVPVMAQVSFGYNFRVFAYFGGYFGYWVDGKREGNTYSMNYLLYGDLESTQYEEGWAFDSNRDNRFDLGLVYGVGIALTIANHYEISAEGRYYYGLSDIHKDYMSVRIPQYNTTLAIQAGVAYKF